jgi:hypothetical protein
MKFFGSCNKRIAGYYKNLRQVFLLMLWIIFFNSCVNKPIAGTTSSTMDLTLDSDIAILTLRPFLKFEKMENEEILPASDFQGDAIERIVLTAATDAIESRKIVKVDCQTQEEMEIAELCNQLHSISPRLSKGRINDKAKVLLKQLASLKEHHAVLAHLVRVKVGPGTFYNPWSGLIHSSMSHTLLRASLIHCKSGRVLWKNQVLLREFPKIESPEFTESLKLLYQHFPKRKEY